MDPVILLTGSVLLLVSASVLTVMYYRRMRSVTKEYSAAKNIVSDVIVSFDKQLQRQGEQAVKVGFKVEALSKRSEAIEVKVEALEKNVATVPKPTEPSETEKQLNIEVENLKKRFDDITKVQEEITKQVSEPPETRIEAVIPIKKERALAPLTETELHVLELIAEKGEKTAPEIKALIKLTREHTARLVKNLYEEGYLERNTEKMPYAYRVKEEMLKILRKTETEPKT